MRRSLLVGAAIVLDAAFGDPPALPHPVRAIGAMIERGEAWVRTHSSEGAEAERIAGAGLTLAIVAIAASAGYIAEMLTPCDIPLAASALALRNLIDECEAVVVALEASDIELARTRVARIVGRDTDALEASEVARATIETLAESLCDGVIAPLFYLTVAGTPGALAYKAINTLDSMIGHIEPPYRDFGWFAARLDDAANWIPARIAAACLIGASALTSHRAIETFATTRRDGDRSSSPNAGQTEAAMAGALGVRLGGVNSYNGLTVVGATFGAEYEPPQTIDVRRAQQMTIVAASIAYAAALIAAWCFDER